MDKIEALKKLASEHIEASVAIYARSPFMSTSHIQEARRISQIIANLAVADATETKKDASNE